MPPSYALFSSGAAFGRAVLQTLLAMDLPPRVVALPQYPPAKPARRQPAIDILAPEHGAWPGEQIEVPVVYTPRDGQAESAARLAGWQCEFLLVACWPWLIGRELVESVPGAALNLHPSLLPRFRGPDPLAAQVAAGDTRFGVSLHLLGPRLDCGDIVGQQRLAARGVDRELADIEIELARLGARLFADALADYPRWNPRPQLSQLAETD